jgi:hypothetical protein
VGRQTKVSKIKRAAAGVQTDPWAEEPSGPTVQSVQQRPIGACGKVCYTSERRAMSCAHAVQQRRKERLRAYRCGRCCAWHLTSEPKWT